MNTTEAIIALIKDGWNVHISPHKNPNVLEIVITKNMMQGGVSIPRTFSQALSLMDQANRKDDLLAFQLEWLYNKTQCTEELT